MWLRDTPLVAVLVVLLSLTMQAEAHRGPRRYGGRGKHFDKGPKSALSKPCKIEILDKSGLVLDTTRDVPCGCPDDVTQGTCSLVAPKKIGQENDTQMTFCFVQPIEDGDTYIFEGVLNKSLCYLKIGEREIPTEICTRGDCNKTFTGFEIGGEASEAKTCSYRKGGRFGSWKPKFKDLMGNFGYDSSEKKNDDLSCICLTKPTAAPLPNPKKRSLGACRVEKISSDGTVQVTNMDCRCNMGEQKECNVQGPDYIDEEENTFKFFFCNDVRQDESGKPEYGHLLSKACRIQSTDGSRVFSSKTCPCNHQCANTPEYRFSGFNVEGFDAVAYFCEGNDTEEPTEPEETLEPEELEPFEVDSGSDDEDITSIDMDRLPWSYICNRVQRFRERRRG